MTERNLELYLGKNIAAICPFKYVGKNNCAHYVGHVLNLQIGILCSLTRRKQPGRASIRVNDIYNSLTSRGLWSKKPVIGGDQNLLVFITSASHVNTVGLMNDNPQKHIGIFVGDKVYNYSNTHHRVVADTVDAFFAKIDAEYDDDDIALYYGVVP
jgi:hypothetical protein